MGPLSPADEVGYREYLRARFMECFGPDDRELTWLVDRLMEDIWAVKLYGHPRLVAIKGSSLPTLKFELRRHETLEQVLAEYEQKRKQNKAVWVGALWLKLTKDGAESLSHSLEVIESYRPGLGQRLSQVAKELMTEPLEQDDKASSGEIAGAASPRSEERRVG